ncbi:MAG: hypothetical protein RIB45_14575 [Marivibrio sp.]|uniref:hypothetical protein n=1 Tax=Marivibrio sp. TaxID=2039719 RepID=UPI0032EEC1A7
MESMMRGARAIWRRTAGAGAAAALFLIAAGPAGAADAIGAPDQPLRFAALGDMPYLGWSEDGGSVVDDSQGRVLVRQIIPAVKAAQPAFTLHYGDLKGGSASCTDALLAERLAQIRAIQPGRTIFTPGDNDWTDCDRDGLAQPMSELERLDRLRALAYRQEEAGAALKPSRQPLYPENARFRAGPAIVASLHVVGTNNGRHQILRDDKRAALAQVDARDAANEVWLAAAFDEAAAADADFVVLVFQADIFKRQGARCTALSREACDGHAWLRDVLKAKASVFDGLVLAIHGDTDDHCLDRPIDGAENFWRLNGPGDRWETAGGAVGGGLLDAVEVTLTPGERPSIAARYLLANEPPPSSCGP